MTIHADHPFLPPGRDPFRRLRGRLAVPVTVWTAADAGSTAGLTVGSVSLTDGAPPTLLGLLDPEADLTTALDGAGRFAVSILTGSDRHLAEVFGGLAPAPGGMFTVGRWASTAWGPVLVDRSWVGCRVVERRPVGYAELVLGAVESITLADAADADGALVRLRGRYVDVSDPYQPPSGSDGKSQPAQ